MKYYKDKKYIIIGILSIFFILINILTTSNLLPWVDEVMFCDTSSNMAMHGAWTTTAWYSSAHQVPFCTYPPLFQMLLFCWIKIFGFSLIACRSFNFILAALTLYVFLNFIQRFYKIRHLSSVVLLCFLFWGAGSLSQIYNNVRPDTLNALLTLLTLTSGIDFIRGNAGRSGLIIYSALLLFSGMQACPYIVALFIFSWFYYNSYRRIITKAFLLFLLGSGAGLAALSIFMLINGHLFSFIISVFSYSNTLKSLCILLLPYCDHFFGFNAQSWIAKVRSQGPAQSFMDKLGSAYTVSPEFLILVAFSFLLVVFLYKKQRNMMDLIFPVFLFSLFVPFFMGSIAGHFQVYYTWMCLFPIIVCIIILCDLCGRYVQYLLLTISVVISCTGVVKNVVIKDDRYSNVQRFIRLLPVTKKSKVVAPFLTFYDIKNKCDSCFFIQEYPPEMVKNVDFIIIAKQGFAESRINDYLKKEKMDTTKIVNVIAKCNNPFMLAYSIKPVILTSPGNNHIPGER